MKLLATGAWREATKHIAEIEAMGHEVVFMQWEHEDIPCDPAEIEGVLCTGLFLHHPVEAFTSLKFVQLYSAGYDRAPMDYFKAHSTQPGNSEDSTAK